LAAPPPLELIDVEGPVVMTQPVLMEVLAGARDDRREADLRRLLLTFELLSFDAVADFDGAVRIYRRCRAAGVTPRGMRLSHKSDARDRSLFRGIIFVAIGIQKASDRLISEVELATPVDH
jgi:predicted nucleic acid-binding protein